MAIEKHRFTPLIEQSCWRNIGVWGRQRPRCERLQEIVHCRNCEVFSEAAHRVFLANNSESDLLAKSKEIYQRAGLEYVQGEFSAVPFRIGRCWYFVPPLNVLNIAENMQIHSLPKRSSDVLLGVAAINGEVHTCINLGKLIGMPDSASAGMKVKGAFERILSIKLNRKRISFVVDEVQTILRFDQQHFAPLDDSVPVAAREYIKSFVIVDSGYLGPMCSLDLDNIENSYRALIA